MYYLIDRLTPRQFEILAANYAKSIAPHYNWTLTKKAIDFNRDFEGVYNNNLKWGEAKHTSNTSSCISKSRWDPTLVSAVLKNNVDEVYLVTCGWIPLEYIVRAEHFRQDSIKRIYYVNGFILDEWLKKHDGYFDNFNEQCDMTKIMHSIKSCNNANSSRDACIISVFNLISNTLEPINTIEKMMTYEINIVAFSSKSSTLFLHISKNFVITDAKVVALSPNSEQYCANNTAYFNNNTINHFRLQKGYNQILIQGFFKSTSNSKETICCTINHYSTKKTLLLNEAKILNRNKLSEIAVVENAYNTSLLNEHNTIIDSHCLDKEDMIRNKFVGAGEFDYYEFSGSICSDSITICRIIAKILLGVDYNLKDELIAEKTINSTLNLCPFWLSNVFIGTTNYIYALYEIEQIVQFPDIFDFNSQNIRLPKGTIIFINKKVNIPAVFQEVLTLIMKLFKVKSNSSIIVLNSSLNDEKTKQLLCKNNMGNNFHNIKHIKALEKQTIDYLWNKSIITSNETSNLRYLGDYYYEKTDFFKALFFYDLIDRKSDNNSIDYTFKFADCLNHCDSMNKAQKQFEKVIKNGNANNPKELKLILEAKTEVFSLRFWRLDTDHLVEDIDELLNRFYQQLYFQNKALRDRYAFYNCLNRKMVTQYLIGDYKNAEATFRHYIKSVDSDHSNYLAFAYMDSARGLYRHDIFLAKKRIETALDILKKLYAVGKEKRRYFDCIVELEYVNFIIKHESGENPEISSLESAVANVRNHGYKSMLIKCYLKLATCYLALKKVELAMQYLSYVKSNCDFKDDIRVAVLYNKITSSLYCAKNQVDININNISDDFLCSGRISFNCISKGTVILESRIW